MKKQLARRSMANLRLQQQAQLRVLSTLTWQALTYEESATEEYSLLKDRI